MPSCSHGLLKMIQPEMDDSGYHLKHIASVAKQFSFGGIVVKSVRLCSGNVNETFLVSFDTSATRVILQRVNQGVFRKPSLVMENMIIISDHVQQIYSSSPAADKHRLVIPRIYKTIDGCSYTVDNDGGFWRALEYIENAIAYDTIQNSGHAREAGRALGTFHQLLADLNPDRLNDTLPFFHNSPHYLVQYQEVDKVHTVKKSPELSFCADFIKRRTDRVSILEDAYESGKLHHRIIHGDPKISNILMDDVSGRARAIIDLDTVKPGLVHYDLGDCLRSCCNILGEETQDYERVSFDLDIAEAILSGYVSEARGCLLENDISYFYSAIWLLAFELGMRFLTDYLAGNVYFAVDFPEHNLCRSLVQFKLTEDIERKEQKIRNVIDRMSY